MLLKPSLILFSLLLLHTIIIRSLIAAPWVEPDDLSLRNDIQLLADAGVISAPVTTYPLMWNAIKNDILSADISALSAMQRQALSHVRFNLKYSIKHSSTTKKSIYLTTNQNRFTSFSNSSFDQGDISLSQEVISGNFAGKIQTNYRLGLNDNPELHQGSKGNLDGSYLAYKLGNWIITGGAIERWWGPGIDTSLILSTNARTLPAISINRDSSDAFKTPWLSWIGPWSFTAQMAQLESKRAVPDALLWSTRATIRPFRGLELGTSWSFQWAGEGQPSSMKDFFEIIFSGQECANGQSDCDPSLDTYLGNHLAGYDIRWSDTLFDLSYAIYLQTIGEDGSPNAGIITDKANMYGIETRFILFNQRIFTNLEYTDTQTACGGTGTTALNCFYEHGTYHSGYRYYHRTIGSTYDNDAQTLVATILIQTNAGNSWQFKFRKLQLNTDNIDRYPDDINLGNPVSKVAEDVLQLDSQYKFIAFDSRFTTGLIITDSTVEQTSDTHFDAYIKWEHKF